MLWFTPMNCTVYLDLKLQNWVKLCVYPTNKFQTEFTIILLILGLSTQDNLCVSIKNIC